MRGFVSVQVVNDKNYNVHIKLMYKNRLVLLTAILLILVGLHSSTAYTDSIGVEKDDVIDVHYQLTVDGKVKEENPNFVTKVSPTDLIQGFYEGLLGMKVGDEKEIIVPPEKGYSTGDLAGKTLYFDVSLNKIVTNVRGDESSDSGSSSGAGTFLKNTGIAILSIGGVYVGWTLYSGMQRASVPKCVDCAKVGQRVRSNGYCASCGNHYCRESYAKGCPSCKGNTLKPLKS